MNWEVSLTTQYFTITPTYFNLKCSEYDSVREEAYRLLLEDGIDMMRFRKVDMTIFQGEPTDGNCLCEKCVNGRKSE